MNLSPHFTLDELLASNTATANHIAEQFAPPQNIIDNLTKLCDNVLEGVRDITGGAINVSSGYRSPALNAKVGGEPTSQHLKGEAADITCPTLSVDELYAEIKQGLVHFDELIIEHDSAGHRWVHISYNTSPNAIQRGICMKGELRPTGGTACVNDGFGAFKNQNA